MMLMTRRKEVEYYRLISLSITIDGKLGKISNQSSHQWT